MSVVDALDLETVEAPVIVNDMANLKLGSTCSCEDQANCRCDGKQSERKKVAEFPYFWRKTRNNPFVKSRKEARKKLHGTFEIIQPSVLNFISPSVGEVYKTAESTDGTSGTHDPHLSSWGSSGTNSNDPVGSAVVCGSNSAALVQEGSGQGEELPSPLSLPDFTSLSLGSEELSSENSGRRGSEKSSIKLSGIVEVRGALVNFRLDPPASSVRSRSARKPPSVTKVARKNRIRATLKPAVLPPIMEDNESENVFSNAETSSSSSAAASSANLNCSQQALMENSGTRSWNQESSDPVDDVTIDELASYLDVFVYIPKKMSPMAEMMYT